MAKRKAVQFGAPPSRLWFAPQPAQPPNVKPAAGRNFRACRNPSPPAAMNRSRRRRNPRKRKSRNVRDHSTTSLPDHDPPGDDGRFAVHRCDAEAAQQAAWVHADQAVGGEDWRGACADCCRGDACVAIDAQRRWSGRGTSGCAGSRRRRRRYGKTRLRHWERSVLQAG